MTKELADRELELSSTPIARSIPRALLSDAPRPSVSDAIAIANMFADGDPEPEWNGATIAAIQAAYAAGYLAGKNNA
jgi:hypothetical protein